MYGGGKLTDEKLFFNDFASKRNFDPLVPSNWYHFTKQDVLANDV